jgi:membrane fusion protein (multidrug efflux system)
MREICRTRLIAAIGILVVGLMLSGCGKAKEGGIPSKMGTPEVAVVVMQEERVVITTELPGRTSPYLVAEVRPQVSGIIQKRLFVEGADVKAGEVLYQIDPAPYQASYDNAKAALVRAEAYLPAARSRVERYKDLVAIKAVSQQDYDDAESTLKQAEATVEVSRAAVETARINLAYTQIKAPISGRIGKSNATVGALATAHQGSPLTTIQQLDPIYVDATQSSANLLQFKRKTEAGRIKGAGPDQARVKLLLEDGTPYPLEGSLKFSDVTVDPSTGSYILRMVFPNPKHTLLPGMYVRPVVQEGIADRAVLVPQQGVSRDPKGNAVVLVVDSSGKVEQRAITVEQKITTADRPMGDKWFVTSGLKTGDRVIVEGMQKVRPGVPVKAVPFDPIGKASAQAAKAAPQPPSKAK